MISYFELKNGLFKDEKLTQIVSKEDFGYIPYLDDKVMEERGFYVVLTIDGVAIIPIETTGLEKNKMKLLDEETVGFLSEQLPTAIGRHEQINFLTKELERYLQGEILVNEMNAEVDNTIISIAMQYGSIVFYDENGDVSFPNDETYKRFYTNFKNEENLLLECIEWTNKTINFYNQYSSKNEINGRRETIELLDVIAWKDMKTQEYEQCIVVQNGSSKINLINAHTGIAIEEEFQSTSELLAYLKEN